MNKQAKNYIGFLNDHSGSMVTHATGAVRDYNTNIEAIKNAATREMQDTVVSAFGFGCGAIERNVVNSNPHVLKGITNWSSVGNTPLYDAIGDMVQMFKSLPDANDPHVSFLLMVTTDGEEYGSKRYSGADITKLIKECLQDERWTFVFRIPSGYQSFITPLGVPLGNIQEWDVNSSKGLEATTVQTTQAIDTFYAARSAGKKSSSVFYANAAQVNVAALKDISSDVSLYVVPDADSGIQIRDFILRHRMEYLKGAAFYQLTKTEARVSHTKMIAIRDRNTGKIYAGKEARDMIGLPNDRNARLHPGDHGNYDIFIQSESVNRKLVGGTGVLYWKAVGVPFTDADLAYLQPKAAPTVIQLPAVAPTNKPTPSPLKPVKKAVSGKTFFATRDEGREAARNTGKPLKDAGRFAPNGQRWYIEA